MAKQRYREENERKFHVALQNRAREVVGRVRQYKSLDNAAKRIVQLMMNEGEVGWVGELYHAHTGMQLGTVRMSATGEIRVKYVWDWIGR